MYHTAEPLEVEDTYGSSGVHWIHQVMKKKVT